MPDQVYHTEKRNRFRDTARFLTQNNYAFSYDATVQDCFYSAMHETERFLAGLNKDSQNHRQRGDYVSNYMVCARRRVVRRDLFNRNPQHPSDRLFDRHSEFCYMILHRLRLDLAYGSHILGPLRHATERDVQRANHLLVEFARALNAHEQDLRARGII